MSVCQLVLKGAGPFATRRSAVSIGGPRLNFLAPLTLTFFLAAQGPARAALPPGWSDTDIGAPMQAGSASYANGVWTNAGGGLGISKMADQFNFASQIFNCDGSITAQVGQVQNTE